ncbi:MAG: class I SAM-dependent methyltransferase [Acidobacteria bacterium]|nr:class I SAM-dependent methyltransferase [Acidobacteriota bacterium]
MKKLLAKFSEISNQRWANFMDELNDVARRGGLAEYKSYSRVWEYPWLWFQLEDAPRSLRILDIGSERSAYPWLLAEKGFDVTVSDVTSSYWGLWKSAQRSLGVRPTLKILDTQTLALPTASFDVYQSVSILEHVPDKAKALKEAARVVRPGGLLLMTFDICEAEMGMTFPQWNGRAVSMAELDKLFADCPWFERGLVDVAWNVETIDEYWAWHRTTAEHHNYVTGAISVKRTQEPWADERSEAPPAEARYQEFKLEMQWWFGEFSRQVKGQIPKPAHSLLKRVVRG